MKKGKFLGSIGLLSAAALTLVACGKSNNNNNSNEGAKTASKFPEAVPTKEAKQGGTVKIALISNSPFTGIFRMNYIRFRQTTKFRDRGMNLCLIQTINFGLITRGRLLLSLIVVIKP